MIHGSIFEKCKGKQVKVPLDLDLYQGKIIFNLSYGSSPIIIYKIKGEAHALA